MCSSADDSDRPGAVHQPVLLRETISSLQLASGLTVVDGTVGAGGHSRKILEAVGPNGRLIGLDRDDAMLVHAARQVAGENVDLVHSSYADLATVLADLGLTDVDRILVDLGLSSDQLADRERGFGFQTAGQLDMRFDRSAGRTASDVLNESTREELKQIFEEYGDEPFAGAIADEIVRRRSESKYETVTELVETVEAAIGQKIRSKSKKHPATRAFQALRIAVNEELEHLRRSLAETFPRCLKRDGLAVVITFHSLEDRIVKQAFQDKATWANLTPKPIGPRPNEQKINPRSRSAKLRAARRI